ncbi:hypothetical protein NKR19_g8342 [Coniochaeta hoffmannii]|uniref:Heterokaryon incompatibility domain-containing protein n=1 Tax=Coniochaeta hoffmannii TaxID=91930 RepID=A0AA38R5Y0_9PEZI|nr:hypothetical protein NKR19_g8342 [Coniochaeta hoffmannii]
MLVYAASESETGLRDHYVKLFEEEWADPDEAQIEEATSPGFQKRMRRELTDGIKGYGECARRIFEACANRAFFVTSRGYVGLAPWSAVRGDAVFVLAGGTTPFILRERVEAGGYGLVGEAYMYGIMGGEAWDWESGRVDMVCLV